MRNDRLRSASTFTAASSPSVLSIYTTNFSHSLEKKKLLNRLQFPGSLYSELPPSITLSPYLTERLSISKAFCNGGEDHHMVVCVHGLDGEFCVRECGLWGRGGGMCRVCLYVVVGDRRHAWPNCNFKVLRTFETFSPLLGVVAAYLQKHGFRILRCFNNTLPR